MLERVHSMPGMSSKAVFSFGQSYGWINAIIEVAGITPTLVEPRVWMKSYVEAKLERGDRKRRLAERAVTLWGREAFLVTPRSKKPHEGLVDAALIAHYGMNLGKT